MKDIEQLIEKLYQEGKLYLVENHKQGCFQLALKQGKKAKPANDPVWELDIKDYYGG